MPALAVAPVTRKKIAIAPLVAPVVRVAHKPVRIPAWAVLTVILMAVLSGYAAGRKKVHHYQAYFGSMVVDTDTGRACYVTAPKPAVRDAVNDGVYPIEGTVNRTDLEPTSGPAIPVCGQD